MPIFKVDIEKSLGAEYWTNRYLVTADDLAAANIIAQEIRFAERGFHSTSVLFTKYRVSDNVPGSDVYVTYPVNDNGTFVVTGELLPLFNTVRVDLSVGIGRPSRKYYRGVIAEGNQAFGTLDSIVTTAVNDALSDVIPGSIVDPQGTPIVGHVVYPQVAMRQLRRGTRRRTTPIIPG